METIKSLITVFALLTTSISSYADNEVLVVKTDNSKTELKVNDEPTMTIGEEIVITSGSTTLSFNPNQRVVLFSKEKDPEEDKKENNGDINGDTKVDIQDVTKLIDMILNKK